MNTKYDINNLLKNKPMKADECARIVISNLNEESDTGKGFLSYNEIIDIRDGKKDNPEYYNELIETNYNTQLMATSAYEAILNLEITTLCLNGILESYINDMHQSRAIRCINRLEEEDSKLSIILTELKDILKNIFIVTAIHVHLRHDIENYKREDFKKSHINESAEFIITLMQKRRDFISSILAYKEMITKGCLKIKINYYLDKINEDMESVNKHTSLLNHKLEKLHTYYTIVEKGYDGFLKKEMDIEVSAKYSEEHEIFL